MEERMRLGSSLPLALAGLLLLGASAAEAQQEPEIRGLYVPTFSTNTLAATQNVVNAVKQSNINQVYVQVRGRADANYFPNRLDSTYPNPEPRGQIYTISPGDLDVLQYYIDHLHNADPPVEVHAWVTVFNSWNRTYNPSSSDHIFNAHPEWRSYRRNGTQFGGGDEDGLLDPALPEVQDHLFNVFMDIVRNYDVDGLHLDYIRLTDLDAGYHPAAKARFLQETGWNFDTQNANGQLDEVYRGWRRDKVAELVKRVHDQIQLEKPWVNYSAFIVGFTDQVRNLAQGFNWWIANGALDTLHPSVYASAVSTSITRWNAVRDRLALNNDQYTRQMVAAVGSYLYTENPPNPDRNVTVVQQLRQNSRKPDGFNFFAYEAIFNDADVSPRNRLAVEMFGPGGPMSEWVPVPLPTHKIAAGMERVPPNPVANLSATLQGGKPLVSFSRPAAAVDGDLPVRFRLYRDTKPAVDLFWNNLVMEWWDAGSARASFEHADALAPTGNVYYKVEAFDEWNNRAVSEALGPVAVTAGGTTNYIIETRAGGHNVGDYSEMGTFFSSTSHSTATGTTPDIGSRFARRLTADDGGAVARFTPSSLPSGDYRVAVTCFNFSSANAPGITVRVSDATGLSEMTYDLTAENAGNKWAEIATMTITAGAGHFIEFDNTTQTNYGTGPNMRMNAAAVRFLAIPAKFEPKPPAVAPPPTFPVGGEVIVDSDPHMLHWDGQISGSPDNGKWALNNTASGYYRGNARFVSPSNNPPFDQFAVWVVDLPRAGNWAIDGWVRDNTSFAQAARYRFVDGNGIVRSAITSQRSTFDSNDTGGWHINVDGVEDSNAYYFNKGRVYVTIHGNAVATSQNVIADALRFRLVAVDDEPVMSAWFLY
jgi:uncharacterized lipoprotein YddW (UPF0748 family)